MRFLSLIFAAVLVLVPAASAEAEVEWDVINTLALEEAPRDVAVSADGRSVYVLLKDGLLQIYSAGGQLQESLELGFPADRIALSSAGSLLYVGGGEEKNLKVVRLEFVQQISTDAAPMKGPPDARVTVAVFNDFQ